MTLTELNKLFSVVQERDGLEDLKKTLIATAYPGNSRLDGMPRGSGISDSTGKLGVELVYLDEQISTLNDEIEQLRQPVEVFIESIKDLRLRMIFRYRYLHAMEWKDVACLIGSGNTVEGIKSAVYRSLRSPPPYPKS